MGNVRSLPNKMDEFAALTRHLGEYRECSIMMLMKTRLTALTPDSATELGSFKLLQADRLRESGKRKGLAVLVSNRWCNSGHTPIKEQLCCGDINLLAVSLRPCCRPRELSQAITICCVYLPRLQTLMQPVMFATLSQAGSRQIAHRPSFLSLATLIVPLHPPLSPLSASMLHVALETVRPQICLMPTTPPRHPTAPRARSDHNLVLLSCTGDQRCPAR